MVSKRVQIIFFLGVLAIFWGCATGPYAGGGPAGSPQQPQMAQAQAPPAPAAPAARQITHKGPKLRVGIVDFANKTSYGAGRLGTSASDILTTELFKTGAFILVERTQLNQVLKEQGLGQSYPLSQALRQISDEALCAISEMDRFQNLVDPFVQIFHSAQRAHEGQVIEDRHFRIERDRLRQVADALANLQRLVDDVKSGDAGRSRGRRHISGQDAHSRGFAGTIGTQKTDDLTLLGVEADALQGRMRAVIFG